MSFIIIKFLNYLKKNKIILNPNNFIKILNEIFNEKDIKIIIESLLFEKSLFKNINLNQFINLNNKEKIKLTSFVFLYFLIKKENNNKIYILEEFLIKYDIININELIKNIEEIKIPNNGINELEDLIKNNNINFSTYQSLNKSLNEREKFISIYNFKKEFINQKLENIFNSEILILKLIKYFKIISNEEIKQINIIKSRKDINNIIIPYNNNKKYFTQTIKPIYSLDEYADMIMNSKEYLEEENKKIQKEKDIFKNKKMENYLGNNFKLKKDNEEEIKKFNLNELGDSKIEDDISDEEQRILDEKKEYYSSGNTHKRG